MKSAYRWISTGALCLASLALESKVFAAELTLPSDGWVSWQVAAVDGAPCHGVASSNSNNFRNAPRTACKLDGKQDSWGNRDDETTDQVRIYARTAGGKLDRLRVLSVSVPGASRDADSRPRHCERRTTAPAGSSAWPNRRTKTYWQGAGDQSR